MNYCTEEEARKYLRTVRKGVLGGIGCLCGDLILHHFMYMHPILAPCLFARALLWLPTGYFIGGLNAQEEYEKGQNID